MRSLIAQFRGDKEGFAEAVNKRFEIPRGGLEIGEEVLLPTAGQSAAQQVHATQGPVKLPTLAEAFGRAGYDKGAIDAQIEANKKWGSSLDSTAGSIKNVRDENDKFAGSLEKSVASVRDAQLAYDKLFTPPETDPLLRQLQQMDEQTTVFINRMTDLAAQMRAQAGKAGIPPEIAKGLNEAAAAFESLAKRAPEGQAAMNAFATDRFFEKAMAENEAATRKAITSLDDFAETTRQQFQMEGFSGLAEGIGDQLDAIAQEAEEKLQIGKWLGIGPEAIGNIQSDAEKAARAIVNSVDPVLRVASERWKKQWQGLLDVKLPAGTNRMEWLATASKGAAEEFHQDLADSPGHLRRAGGADI